MKAACVKDDKIVIQELLKPELKGKGAILRTFGCGLCGSDIVKFRQKFAKDGTVLGHEIVGEIVEINSQTDFKVGDKIVSSHHIPCYNCAYCQSGNYSMCSHFKETNIEPGGFCEYIYLSEEHLQNVALKIPENLDEIEASFYEPLGCCVRAVKRAVLPENSKVLVVGLGSIGILMGQALKSYSMEVFACDLLEERIKTGSELGLECFNSSDTLHSEEFILSKTGKLGVDAVFMTSGSDRAIDLALKTVRNGGKIIVFASTPKNFGYANNEIYYRELTVMGSYSPSPQDLKDSMELLSKGKVVVKNLSSVYDLEDIEKSFRDTIENKVLKAYIRIKK